MQIHLKTAIFWICVVAALGYGVGWHASRYDLDLRWNGFPKPRITSREPPEAMQADFRRFWKVWDLLEKEYYERSSLEVSKMVDGAIAGVVSSLDDPYTSYFPPDQNKTVREDLQGSFEGIGIHLGFQDKRLAVIAPLPETPAEQAGVKAGDLIVRIDGADTAEMSLPEAVEEIRGPQGTIVTLTVEREGKDEPIDIPVTRGVIRIFPVTYEVVDENIALLHLPKFDEAMRDEWTKAIDAILEGEVDGIILDLRNNPGGYLEGAEFIAAEFLVDGPIVHREDAAKNRTTESVNRRGRLVDVPLVILVNKGSASASEIVAGAIQDRGRGKLVGEETFGKGTVQDVRDLDQGAAVHITTQKWLLPSGKAINGDGLTPDVEVKDDPETEEDEQKEHALVVLREMIGG